MPVRAVAAIVIPLTTTLAIFVVASGVAIRSAAIRWRRNRRDRRRASQSLA